MIDWTAIKEIATQFLASLENVTQSGDSTELAQRPNAMAPPQLPGSTTVPQLPGGMNLPQPSSRTNVPQPLREGNVPQPPHVGKVEAVNMGGTAYPASFSTDMPMTFESDVTTVMTVNKKGMQIMRRVQNSIRTGRNGTQ